MTLRRIEQTPAIFNRLRRIPVETLDALTAPLVGSLIEASAGTGKTYTITTLFLRLILERHLSVSEVLVVTFTKAATAEVRDRIRSRLRNALTAISAPSSDPVLSLFAAAGGDLKDARRRIVAA